MVSIEEAHAALLKQDRLQFDWSDATPRPPPDSWVPHLSLNWSPLGWMVIAIAALLVLAVIWHAWRTRSTEPLSSPVPEQEPVIRLALARATLAIADDLAAEERFAEAAHALLACGIDEIDRRFPALLRPAATSRDIGALMELPGSFRGPFARIAATVELGIFASRPISADSYADCRRAFVTSALAKSS